MFLCCKQLAVGYRESEMIFWTLSGQNSLVKRQTKNQTNKKSNKTRLSLKRVEKHSLSGVFFYSFSFYFSVFEVDISIIWVLQMRAVNAFLGQDFIYEWVEFMWHGQGQSHQRKENVHVISDPFRNIKILRGMFLTDVSKIYFHVSSVHLSHFRIIWCVLPCLWYEKTNVKI